MGTRLLYTVLKFAVALPILVILFAVAAKYYNDVRLALESALQ